MDSFIDFINNNLKVSLKKTIRLGTMSIRIVANTSDLPALKYFSKKAINSTIINDEEVSFELYCISLKNENLDLEYIRSKVDSSYRANSFYNGYYATDHFGLPIYLVSFENKYYVFGENLENVVWPYFVKYFLMLHSMSKKSLFIKSAALSFGENGTLILGRGGSGKTVFLTQLCQSGAKFVTNSHSLIGKGRMVGVASSIRVRPGYWYKELLENVERNVALNPNEIIIDPYDVFNSDIDATVNINNLCIIDFKEKGFHHVEKISWQDAYNYAEQFSLGINVYRLEEDLLDYCRNDFKKFSEFYETMKFILADTIKNCNCYYISTDLLVNANKEEVINLLSK